MSLYLLIKHIITPLFQLFYENKVKANDALADT